VYTPGREGTMELLAKSQRLHIALSVRLRRLRAREALSCDGRSLVAAATAAGLKSCDHPSRHVTRVLASTVSPSLRSESALECSTCMSPRGLPIISDPEECAVMPNTPLHHVVMIGGGFGGLYAAKALRGAPVRVTLVDRRNFHLFQPLLYQVATGGLSAGDISYPLRSIFKHEPHFSVIIAEVTDIDVAQRTILLRDGRLSYDTLIVAPRSTHQYFGHDDWATYAPALKTIEDALEIRRRIFVAFEAAEREPDPEKRRALMTFVIIGGGPTGGSWPGRSESWRMAH
jgi:NADPH-dependent 2,4-dienoyl-CoA reductase/sulfur reductase-like enzyme